MNTTMNEGNKCDELGFIHAWKDNTPNGMYPTYPPKYPNKSEMCENCGLERELVTTQVEIKSWIIKVNKTVCTQQNLQQ